MVDTDGDRTQRANLFRSSGESSRPDLVYDRYVNDIVFEQWYSQLLIDGQHLLEKGDTVLDKNG